MLSETRSTPVRSPAAVTPDPITGPVSNGSAVATDPDVASAPASAATANGRETRGEHFRRKAHRTRLHGYAIVGLALVAYLIALAASNIAHVKVNWVFGSSHVSLLPRGAKSSLRSLRETQGSSRLAPRCCGVQDRLSRSSASEDRSGTPTTGSRLADSIKS
jgi:hypothetical protein